MSAQRRRATPEGAETNRMRVMKDRAKLGRAYLGQLIAQQCGVTAAEVPSEAIDAKRQSLVLRRIAHQILSLSKESMS